MEHPRMEVMCHVNNCEYNKTDYCYAPKIEVNGKKGDSADNSKEALCSTFRPE